MDFESPRFTPSEVLAQHEAGHVVTWLRAGDPEPGSRTFEKVWSVAPPEIRHVEAGLFGGNVPTPEEVRGGGEEVRLRAEAAVMMLMAGGRVERRWPTGVITRSWLTGSTIDIQRAGPLVCALCDLDPAEVRDGDGVPIRDVVEWRVEFAIGGGPDAFTRPQPGVVIFDPEDPETPLLHRLTESLDEVLDQSREDIGRLAQKLRVNNWLTLAEVREILDG